MAPPIISVLASVVAQEMLQGALESELDHKEDFLASLTIEENLKCAAVTKPLLDKNDCSDSAYVPLRIVLQSLKSQRVQSIPQTLIKASLRQNKASEVACLNTFIFTL